MAPHPSGVSPHRIQYIKLWKNVGGEAYHLQWSLCRILKSLLLLFFFIVELKFNWLKVELNLKINMVKSSTNLGFAVSTAFVFNLFINLAQAQQENATTDPYEARVLNSIFNKWGISPSTVQSIGWNISGELCSGKAIDRSTLEDNNPIIKCSCSFDDSTTCRIIGLKVTALDVIGIIPEELWTLTYLTNLNLGQNYLRGSLPPAIGNLTRMQYMNFGGNVLSGELPKELGNLTELISLSININRFNGSLPSELGKLVKLEQLYIDSSGASGPIPSTFKNLKSLGIVWASDIEFTGRIPDFIGNWTMLTVLRFQGNCFEGSIPSSFSKLTSLTELRISGLSNGSTSLEFIRNMKSLTVLELRNNNISGSIPSYIGEFSNLVQLDLSFNNIIGEIPSLLFSLRNLSHVFLGNNKLDGILPTQKSTSLQNIDLSYNYLSGSFPSWINEQDLQLNLVANNFTMESSNSSGLLSGLNCLQRNFPCNHGIGRYYNFSIKCGGPQIISSKGVIFEKDDETLGPATYFVSETERWAVSNVGLFTESNDPQYKSSVTNQFTATVDSELFQTARLSASSLRYYGLGLENGYYNITLQFAETGFLSSGATTWRSLGRRVFDIYTQGNRVLKDFDIQKEAGGFSFRAVQKEFRALVSENYLEIHLFWAGKGTCCIPVRGTYGPMIQAIKAIPDFIPTVSNEAPTTTKKDKTGLIVGIAVSVGVVCCLSVFIVFFIIQRRKHRRGDDEEFSGIDASLHTFRYSELKKATDDFNLDKKLGEGGFGPVFKGTLNDGRVVAVKQLSAGSHQGKSQFINEIATISAVRHRNLVELYGCCIERDERLLVYEYQENKSLDQALFGNCLNLNWTTRYYICLGVARGLAYLHEESRLRIVHRDVKASNILLDHELLPKLSDFGLAKLYDNKKTHTSTGVAGTIGYLAPEYALRGHLTEKADVFSFGIVALEIISGRPNSDSTLEGEKVYLLEWAWNLFENKLVVELVDPRLSEFNEEEVKRLAGIALLCLQTSPALRPSMSRVVAMLSGDIEVSPVTSKPVYLTDWKFDDVTSLMTDIATKGLNTSYYNSSSTNISIIDGGELSTANPAKPILDRSL